MGVSSSSLLLTKALEVRVLQHSSKRGKNYILCFTYLLISKLPHHHAQTGWGDRKLEKTWGRGDGLMWYLVVFKVNVVVEWCREGCMREWRVRVDPSRVTAQHDGAKAHTEGTVKGTIEDSSFTGDGKDDVRVDVVQRYSSHRTLQTPISGILGPSMPTRRNSRDWKLSPIISREWWNWCIELGITSLGK